jgi:hypothetical protein
VKIDVTVNCSIKIALKMNIYIYIYIYICVYIYCQSQPRNNNNKNSSIRTSIQDQLPVILTILSNNNFNDSNDYQRHSALYLQFIVLHYIPQTQDKCYIHQDI